MDKISIPELAPTGVLEDDLWRIHLDLVQPSPWGPWFVYDNCSAAAAQGIRSAWAARRGGGCVFTDRSTGQVVEFDWSEIADLRIMPMREAL